MSEFFQITDSRYDERIVFKHPVFSLFTVWVLTIIGVSQALSVLISFVVFWFLVGCLPFIFSIFLHGYNNICSNFINF